MGRERRGKDLSCACVCVCVCVYVFVYVCVFVQVCTGLAGHQKYKVTDL